MKLKLMILSILLFGLFLTGCANIHGRTQPTAALFARVQAHDAPSTLALRTGRAGDNISVSMAKKGTSQASSVFGLYAYGDAGITKAMKNGGITKVHHVEYEDTVFLYGIFHNVQTIVYGE